MKEFCIFNIGDIYQWRKRKVKKIRCLSIGSNVTVWHKSMNLLIIVWVVGKLCVLGKEKGHAYIVGNLSQDLMDNLSSTINHSFQS